MNVRQLIAALQTIDPDTLVCVWDSQGPRETNGWMPSATTSLVEHRQTSHIPLSFVALVCDAHRIEDDPSTGKGWRIVA